MASSRSRRSVPLLVVVILLAIAGAVAVGASTPLALAAQHVAASDSDGDGVANDVDTDDDGDGLLDQLEDQLGTDDLDVDSNDDGAGDRAEVCREWGICTTPDPERAVITDATSVLGAAGDDLFVVTSSGTSTCNGRAGDDVCVGAAADDACAAGAGDDVCIGSAGDDTCTSTTGSDTCIGGAGDDTCTARTLVAEVAGGADALTPPRVVCIGGTGDDQCTATLRGEDEDAPRATTRMSCFGGTGDDVCASTPQVVTEDTGRITMIAQCVGGAGDDHCLAKGVTGLMTGSRVATGARTVCSGGVGNDFGFVLNGRVGDVVNGGPGDDLCIGDVGDRFLSCTIAIALDTRRVLDERLAVTPGGPPIVALASAALYLDEALSLAIEGVRQDISGAEADAVLRRLLVAINRAQQLTADPFDWMADAERGTRGMFD